MDSRPTCLTTLILLAICLALLAGCYPPTATVAPQNATIPADFQVAIELEPCFGACPVYTMTVSADGAVVFDGINFVLAEGEQTATIPPQQVEELVTAIEAADFFNLKDIYTVPVTDLPATTTTVTMNGQTKSVYHYGIGCDNEQADSAPDELCAVEALLEAIPVANGWVEGSP